jgi:hypothetical protein
VTSPTKTRLSSTAPGPKVRLRRSTATTSVSKMWSGPASPAAARQPLVTHGARSACDVPTHCAARRCSRLAANRRPTRHVSRSLRSDLLGGRPDAPRESGGATHTRPGRETSSISHARRSTLSRATFQRTRTRSRISVATKGVARFKSRSSRNTGSPCETVRARTAARWSIHHDWVVEVGLVHPGTERVSVSSRSGDARRRVSQLADQLDDLSLKPDCGARAHATTSTGVPSGRVAASRVMAALSMRMQPCVTLLPNTDASLLPWIPTSPSPPLKVEYTSEWLERP